MAAWRLELFFKTSSDLKFQIPFLKQHVSSFQGVNITNKTKDDDLVGSVKLIREHLPEVDVCVHVSLKHQAGRTKELALQRVTSLLETFESLHPRCSVLLVSGSGKKKPLDTISTLEALAKPRRALAACDTPLYVAFNPYLPPGGPREEEYERFRRKIGVEPGRIDGVYFQMGCDESALDAGVRHVQQVLDEAGTETKERRLYGSVFIPSKKLLAQMRFRPWNGVFLTSDYLDCVEGARAVTERLLRSYARHGIIPLVESAVKNEQELINVQELLSSAIPEKKPS